VGQRGRRWGAVVRGAAPVSELSSVESAATRGTAGETVLLRGADTVCRRRGGGTPRGGAATEQSKEKYPHEFNDRLSFRSNSDDQHHWLCHK